MRMWKTQSIKYYLIYCLVALQVLAPFLHAHLWGEGMIKKSQGFHLHLDTFEPSDSYFKKPTLQTNHDVEHSVGILTGITNKLQLDLPALPAVSFLLALILLAFSSSKSYIRPLLKLAPLLLPPSRASP